MNKLYNELIQKFGIESFLFDYKIGKLSWMKTGGNAKIIFRPKSKNDLSDLLIFSQKLNLFENFLVLGCCSNIIVRDGGIEDLVIILPKDSLATQNEDLFSFSAGETCYSAAKFAEDKSYSGMEFLLGIPGSIGGAVFMNAGANGSDVSNIIENVEIINKFGNIIKINKKDLKMNYRDGGFHNNEIIISAEFKLEKNDKKMIFEKGFNFLQERIKKFPMGKNIGTAGSTFKNPKGPKLAWQLIDESGCRGMKLGGAMMSEKHANFLINTGDASANDLECLGEKVRAIVLDNTGVLLEWEIVRIGKNI